MTRQHEKVSEILFGLVSSVEIFRLVLLLSHCINCASNILHRMFNFLGLDYAKKEKTEVTGQQSLNLCYGGDAQHPEMLMGDVLQYILLFINF